MKKTTIALYSLVVVAALAGSAFGSGGGYVDPNSPLGSNTFDTGDALKSLAKAVLAVVILGVAAVYVTKKVMPKVTAAMGKEMKIVETMALGPRKHVYIVKVGSKKLLLGGASDSITYLADVTDAVKEGKNE
jgi:flagellar biogenesis protein FliO